ncbi:hypothetical protein BGW42_001526 [Actinomortierella wolfii]|nr:hypothetical protein BGW42_001526 [Actinomortierella wolfii]
MAVFTLAVAALAVPALVAGECINRNFGYGTFPRPCNCPGGYTIFQNQNCGGASVYRKDGGWTTGSNQWPVQSYECDPVTFSGGCVNQNFGYGVFQKPCDCPKGYTIFQNANCGGATVHIKSGGWTTQQGKHWPVKSYRCDKFAETGRCINHSFGKGTFPKPSNCPGGYTIYKDANCGGTSSHRTSGGWTSGDKNWNVESYRCDAVPVGANRCINRQYGVGTHPKPSECAATGLTIYQGDNCSGAMVHVQNGWTTSPSAWPVRSFRCDDNCTCQRRNSLAFLYEPEYFERLRNHENEENAPITEDDESAPITNDEETALITEDDEEECTRFTRQ